MNNRCYTDNKPSIQLFCYDEAEYVEMNDIEISDLRNFDDNWRVNWLNIYGIDNPKAIGEICKIYSIHSLAEQDVLDLNQRAKVREYDNYLFFTIKSILPSEEDQQQIQVEQMSFVLGQDKLISFQEKKADYFDDIRKKIREHDDNMCSRGCDYLLFLLLDAIVDNYFHTVIQMSEDVEELSDFDLEVDPEPEIFKQIERFRKNIDTIKKSIQPLAEFVTRIERRQHSFIEDRHLKYYYDLKDSTLSLQDMLDKMIIRLDSSANLFFSVQGHKMNNIMRTLTIVSTIFIPLSFFAGVYGMNFENFPETTSHYGYFVWWGVMVVLALIMLMMFKRRKWF